MIKLAAKLIRYRIPIALLLVVPLCFCFAGLKDVLIPNNSIKIWFDRSRAGISDHIKGKQHRNRPGRNKNDP